MKDETLKRPFYTSPDALEFYALAVQRWQMLSADQVLTEAARLFNFAVAIAGRKPCE